MSNSSKPSAGLSRKPARQHSHTGRAMRTRGSSEAIRDRKEEGELMDE